MKLKQILSNNAYWTINKSLANEIGLDATVLLQHFVDLQDAFFKDGAFYQQQDRLINDLPLTRDYLRKATKVLVKKGFITVVKRGVPAKNHYEVLEKNILSFLVSTTSSVSEAPLEGSKKHDKHKELKDTKNLNTNTSITNNKKPEALKLRDNLFNFNKSTERNIDSSFEFGVPPKKEEEPDLWLLDMDQELGDIIN
jgi:hypothetical protein